jgi:hypothetical protein
MPSKEAHNAGTNNKDDCFFDGILEKKAADLLPSFR